MKHLFTSILAFSFFLFGYGQSTPSIMGNDAVEIIDELSTKILSDYLYPKKAEIIATRLNNYRNQLISNEMIETKVFTDDVNAIMFDATKDHHLKFYFDQQKFEIFQEKNQTIIDSLERELYRRVNFGVQKVENLINNIGLLRLNKFQQYEDVQEVLLGAMMTLANSDAVIIDLRINGGGDGRTMEYLEAFFLSKEEYFNRETEFINTTEYRAIKGSCSICSQLERVPLYILTGNGTFSAAEGFCYDLQQLNRAQIIGTKTKGGGHSGSSVALKNGFLVFIPTSGKDSPIEGVGITPNLETTEKAAFLSAQREIMKLFTSSCTDSTLLSQYKWNTQTIEATLANRQLSNQILESFEGEYSAGFSVKVIDSNLYLVNDEKEMKSKLIAIDEGYFIASEKNDFGEGNYRIQFLNDGQAKLQVNLGVKVAEMPLKKKN